MGKYLSGSGEVDHVLLAMNSHDLKRVVRGLLGMLGSFATDVKREQSQSDEMLQVAGRIEDMQQAVDGVLSNIDDIILTLDRACPSAGQIGALVQHFEMEGKVRHGRASEEEAHDRWMQEVSGLPPHLWNM